MYDALVVGAGPGGATVARYLSEKGHSVALIDRESFPRDKPCGGGFAYDIIEEFPYLKKRENQFLTGISKVGVLHSPNRKISLRGKVSMATALRYDFDNALFESAIECGAEPILKTRVKAVRIKEDQVIASTSDRDITGQVVIGADGVGSTIARNLGLHRRWPSKSISACRVVEVPDREEHIKDTFGDEYHFFANLGGRPGYGWIFPKRETVNVGIGIVGSHAQGLPVYFARFVKMLKSKGLLEPNANVRSARGALVPTGGTIAKTYCHRAVLVGDSAGMVSPITGGGIHYAMVAGRAAAQVIARGLEIDNLSEEFLKRYQGLWMADFGKDIKPMLFAQRILTGPFTQLLFEIASRDVALQDLVSDAMAESSGTVNIAQILSRTLKVVTQSAFHL